MRIGAISGTTPYSGIYFPEDERLRAERGVLPADASGMGTSGAGTTAVATGGSEADTAAGAVAGTAAGVGASGAGGSDEAKKAVLNPGESDKVAPGRKSSPAECKTCAERKYQDGSDEMVSFKSAAHISPEASASRVRAHEQEHVSNAYKKAAQKGGKVLQASVSLTTSICPECGRSYVSGGLTRTQILYHEESPYSKQKKALDAPAMTGNNFSTDA